jgi:ABC-type cobalt transport system substrate-binding protein
MAILLNNQRVLGISIIFYLVGGFNPSEKYESQLG